ncbi:hypothetical protein [Massilia oculi]|uniref:hypothetical protein n=1 Tax=Massilia oculi TaxID=945844 RepID=UPI001AAE876E|nr:hypothetical protein [Massilia oculi]
MTEESKDNPNPMNGITGEDIRDFVVEKVTIHTCPACAQNNWSVIGDEDHTISLMALHKTSGFAIPPPSIPVAAIACNNCGYIRCHALGLIATWKAQKG